MKALSQWFSVEERAPLPCLTGGSGADQCAIHHGRLTAKTSADCHNGVKVLQNLLTVVWAQCTRAQVGQSRLPTTASPLQTWI